MPIRKSAGILLYKWVATELFILLVHPGGPFWQRKDAGAWTIPKGEFTDAETALAAAIREFKEETGTAPKEPFIALKPIIQKAGKQVYAWATKGDLDANAIISNTFKMEWPPKSGRWQTYPEVDKAAWFTLPEARQKINAAQVAFLNELERLLAASLQ